MIAIFTHGDGNRGDRVFSGVCLSVCASVCFPHVILKTAAAKITKLDIQMFHHES